MHDGGADLVGKSGWLYVGLPTWCRGIKKVVHLAISGAPRVGKIDFCGKWSKRGTVAADGTGGFGWLRRGVGSHGLLPRTSGEIHFFGHTTVNTPSSCGLLFAGLFGKRVKIMESAPWPPLGAAHLGSYELRIWGIPVFRGAF